MKSGKLLLVTLIVIAIAAFWLSGGSEWLTLDALKQNRAALEQWNNEHFSLALTLYAFAYVLVTALSLPGAA
ncbi:MAG: hypothetical protein R3180_05395, partial [Marinobacter sp.]|nr:hypothetical protein [Marinobacter sp.]